MSVSDTAHWSQALAQCHDAGIAYTLVSVIAADGSLPRNPGSKMVVTDSACFDTIGGGNLEYQAIDKARHLLSLATNEQVIEHYLLGPDLQQCCGGRVSILFESYTNTRPQLAVFGAGHVGRALMRIVEHLPLRVLWLDNRPEQFPADSQYIEQRLFESPEQAVSELEPGHLAVVLTHDHDLDFALCAALLTRNEHRYVGVIGSNTKAKRFQQRLSKQGIEPDVLAGLDCPMGIAQMSGKLPMEVALSIACGLAPHYQSEQNLPRHGKGVDWRSMQNQPVIKLAK